MLTEFVNYIFGDMAADLVTHSAAAGCRSCLRCWRSCGLYKPWDFHTLLIFRCGGTAFACMNILSEGRKISWIIWEMQPPGIVNQSAIYTSDEKKVDS